MKIDYKKLKKFLAERIPVEEYFREVFESFELGQNVSCPYHEDKNPSMSISHEGKVFCHSCGFKATSIIGFHEKFHELSFKATLKDLYNQYCEPLIKDKLVEKYQRNLKKNKKAKLFLLRKRQLSKEIIDRFQIGYDPETKRITIPVKNEWGYFVNTKKYDWRKKQRNKMIHFRKGFGKARIFPLEILLDNKKIFIFEGEMDTLLALSLNLKAITVGQASIWKEEWNEYFRGKEITICYDVNDKNRVGEKGALNVANNLLDFADSIKVINLPLKYEGGDFTDYIKSGKTKKKFLKLENKTKFFKERTEPITEKLPMVHLSEASQGKYYHKKIRMKCIVSGKDLAPFLIPRKVKISCRGDKQSCEFCHMSDSRNSKEVEFNEYSEKILALINCSKESLHSSIKLLSGIPKNCQISIKILEAFNIEEVKLIPDIDFSYESKYVIRQAYYLGHGLECNKSYIIEAITVPDPQLQFATHIITKAQETESSINSFKLSDELKTSLKKFRPKQNTGEGIIEKLKSIYHILSHNVTKIFMRWDLHMIVDLIFHSPLHFNFNKEYIHKGWLEVLIIGDTRCGKGFVAERLSKFYGLGEVVSGENSTFVGLIGGLFQTKNRMLLTWGRIPLNDKKLVIIDELSELSPEQVGRMTRVRSEGIAEIDKGEIHARTTARTRLIFLSNTRSGRALDTYNNGVDSIRELFGRTEDISRLDLALTVAHAEVPSSVINKVSKEAKIKDVYGKDLFRSLILWTWTRKTEQIKFTENALKLVLAYSRKLGIKYSSMIPLVQAETIRIKLSKIAVAIAARVFSTDEECENIIIKTQHVKAGFLFLNHIYSKPSMAYDSFSKSSSERNKLKDVKTLDKLIEALEENSLDFVEGLLELGKISASDIQDFIGSPDLSEVKALISELVRLRAIRKIVTYYIKRPPFILYLRHKRDELKKKPIGKRKKEKF